MILIIKHQGEFIKKKYLNEKNTAEAAHVYHRNHTLRRCPCSITTLCDLLNKIEEARCTCDRPQFERPSVPVNMVAEVRNRI